MLNDIVGGYLERSRVRRGAARAAIAVVFVVAGSIGAVPPLAVAADNVADTEQAPEPPIEQKGIWGAISYSPVEDKYGLFWGADKREEAEDVSMKHCRERARIGCQLVITFRNHRHWTDNDGSGFPYAHCAAISIAKDRNGNVVSWAAASAETAKQAQEAATKSCGRSKDCEIRESVCT